MPMPCDDDSIAQEIPIYYGETAVRERVFPALIQSRTANDQRRPIPPPSPPEIAE